MDYLINKVIETKDKDFIKEIISRGKDISYLFSEEKLEKIKDALLKEII